MPPGAGAQPPREGDGFTFEHLAQRDSIWLDFCADIGDGGDPTYAVAYCMAAPVLLATVPADTSQSSATGPQSLHTHSQAYSLLLLQCSPSSACWDVHIQAEDNVARRQRSEGCLYSRRACPFHCIC